MKKRIISLLIISIILFSFPAVAFETYGSFLYVEENGEITLTGTTQTVGALNIPSRIDGVSVTGIDSFAFAYGSYSSLILPYTLTSIGSGAFMGCENITSVKLPDNVIKVGDSAFFGCSSLSYAIIPSSVEYIGIDVFSGCGEDFYIKGFEGSQGEAYAKEYGFEFESLGIAEDSSLASGVCGENAVWKLSKLGVLTISGEGSIDDNSSFLEYKDEIISVVIEEGITSVNGKAFREFKKIEVVILPETLEEIGDYAFEKCSLLLSVSLPGKLRKIGTFAFNGCVSLNRIVFPESLRELGTAAFQGANALKEININEGLETMGSSCFLSCSGIKKVTLPGSLELIPTSAFSNCKALETVVISEGVRNISNNAFESCKLNEIDIPASVMVVSKDAIDKNVLIKCYEDSAAMEYANANGNPVENKGVIPDIILESGKWGENINWAIDTNRRLIISGTGEPVSTSTYSEYPWNGKDYSEIVIKKGVTVISDYMFYGSKATSVSLPEGLKKINYYAFANCKYIEKVEIPEGVTEIEICAFRSCLSLSEVHIPSSVIIMRTDLYPFDRCPSSLVLYVYEGTVAEAAAITKGTTYVSLPLTEEKVVLQEKYDDNISYSITNKGKLTVWAETPTELPSFTQFPWRSIKTLRSLSIGKNITSLGRYAFYELTALKSIEFSEFVSYIENYVFDTFAEPPVIKGYSGSVAEEFAKNNGYTFESLGEAPTVIIAEGNYEYNEGGWTIDSNGTLTLGGKGMIDDWTIPWPSEYNERIKKVVISDGVNYINYGLFYQLYNVTEAVIPASFIVFEEALFPYDAVIYGYSGSRAESWAEEYGYSFESLGEMPDMILAEGTAGTDTVYTLDSKGVLTLSGDGYVSDKPWTRFETEVKKIKVESGITGLTSNAFSELPNLTEAEFSSEMNISRMGNVFYCCPGLEKVIFPPVSVLESYFLQDCDSIEYIVLPDTLTSINSNAIYGCDNLKRVEFPATVSNIGENAVFNCGINVKIAGYDGSLAQTYAQRNGYEFESLGKAALKEPITGEINGISWCLGIDGVLTIEGEGYLPIDYYLYAPWYEKRDYVEKVIIGGGVTNTGNYTFYNYKYLKEVVLGAGVIEIGSDAFSGCSALEKISLPEGLEAIGSWAFQGCKALEEILIPESVKSIGYAFYDAAPNLVIKGYSYSEAENFALENGIDFISIGVMERAVIDSGYDANGLYWEFDNYGTLKIEGFGEMENFVPNNAPWKKYEVKNIVVGEGIKTIGTFAFSNMESVKSVSLPEGLEAVLDCAFTGCGQMKMLMLPESVFYIGNEAFASCWYGVITGSNIQVVGNNAFMDIRVYGVPGGEVEKHANISGNCTFLPITSKGECGADAEWSFDVRTGILSINGNGNMYEYPDIGWESSTPWYQFRGDIRRVEIGEGITYIGEGTFHYLVAKEISLPSTLETIGAGAFEYSAFSEIIIPEGCVSIRERAFQYIDGLKKVVIPGSVTNIAPESFEGNDKLTLYVYKKSFAEAYAKDCGINYEILKEAPKLYEIYSETEDGYVIIAADGVNLDGYDCYAKITDENGALLRLLKLDYNGGFYGSAEVSGAKSVQCFIWNSLSEMMPLCESIGTEIISAEEVQDNE